MTRIQRARLTASRVRRERRHKAAVRQAYAQAAAAGGYAEFYARIQEHNALVFAPTAGDIH